MIYFSLFALSLLLTYMVRLLSYKNAIMDIPNERSAHTIPTPRGGGIGLLIVFYTGLIYFSDEITESLFYALLWGLPVAIIGFLDDIVTLSSKIRFVIQSISALGALYVLGGVDSIDFLFFELHGTWLNIFAFLSILWLINLYNFLDGIDGYAGSQAVSVGLGIYILLDQTLGMVIAVASLGFLFFNWHKASIFMGDVGSATLGFIFAIFIFSDTGEGNIYIWLILLSLFWFDATVTLVRRYLNGEKVTQAHNKHAYQRLVQSGWSHDRVVMYALVFNFIFLLLLYLIEESWIVLVGNLLCLMLLYISIEKKKRFE